MDNNKNKPKTLNWLEFQSMGNPENAEESPAKPEKKEARLYSPANQQRIRISLDRKKRKGKGVTVIEGLRAQKSFMEELTRELKKKCGVGGSFKDELILIQGDHRNKIKDLMIEKGFSDTKLSGG